MKKMSPARLAVASAVTAAIALTGATSATAAPKHTAKHSHVAKGENKKFEPKKFEPKKYDKKFAALKAKAAREATLKVAATDRVKFWLGAHDLGTVDDNLFARVAVDKQALLDARALILSATTAAEVSAPAKVVAAFKPETYKAVHSVLARDAKDTKVVGDLFGGFDAVAADIEEAAAAGGDVTNAQASLAEGVAALNAANALLAESVAVADKVSATDSPRQVAMTLVTARAKTALAEKQIEVAKEVYEALTATDDTPETPEDPTA